MSEIKIYLEPDETIEEVQENLIKAFQAHALGEFHKEDFQDAAARDVYNKMIKEHEKMWEILLKEIAEVLEGEK